jgi:two-component system cell cycle response regulator
VSASPATVWVTRLPGWGWYLCGGAVLVGVYFLLAVIDGAGTVKVAVYGAISLSAPVAVLVGVRRHSPRRRLPWYLVGGGQAAYGIGTLAIRMALGCTDVTATHRLLYGWAGGLFTADIAFGYLQLTGGYDPGGVLDLLWLTSALALGAAALHPSMRVLDQSAPAPEPIIGFGRLSALAVTCLAAPALLYLEYLQRAPLHVPLIAAASAGLFLLALARMKVLADGQRHAAITDSLTGLRTRRFLQEAMLRQVGPGTGLLLLDVDHFKKINDGYGHGAGDEELVELARRLLATVRRGDVVARYGGEEFAVLLPRTDVAEMAASAERIRQSIAATPMSGAGRLLSVTVSVGGAALRPGQSIDEWIADADRALYAAKDAGRNRVVTPALARATHLPVDVWAA